MLAAAYYVVATITMNFHWRRNIFIKWL